jgi:hypothetical protein
MFERWEELCIQPLKVFSGEGRPASRLMFSTQALHW